MILGVLDDLAYRLEQRTVGMVGLDIYKSFQPPEPDSCITLFELPIGEAYLHWNGEEVRVDIRVRDSDYFGAKMKAQRVFEALHGLTEETILSPILGTMTRYLLVEALAPPGSIGRDQNERSEFLIKLRIIKERDL